MTKPEESKAEESKAEESLALIHAFLDGGATAEECALLDQKLAADPQFAQAFCDAAETDVLLAELWSQRQEKEVAKSVLSQIDRQGASAPSHQTQIPMASSATSARRQSGGSVSKRAWNVQSLALVLLIGVTLGVAGLAVWRFTHEPVVAQLTRMAGARWTSDQEFSVDKSLVRGSRLELNGGLVEVQFTTGVRVILEGPATFTLMDEGAVRLDAGKLVAHVPKPAQGFAVHTPCAVVTDRGTEFSVWVRGQAAGARREQGADKSTSDRPQITDVYVFKGAVDVAAIATGKQDQAPRRMTAGEAVRARADSRTLQAIDVKATHYDVPTDYRGLVERYLRAISQFEREKSRK